MRAVKDRHAPIGRYLQSGKATELQRIDSDIAEQVMLGMMRRNVLVLPIHDSFIVRSGFALLLQEQMEAAYERRFGHKLDIKTILSSFHERSDNKPLSRFEQFDAVLDRSEEERSRYTGYYQRSGDFAAKKSPEYFTRFEFQ